MPIPNEYREIIIDLKHATDEGRINWSATQLSGAFIEISDSVLELWGGEDHESDKWFVSCSLKNTKKRQQGISRDKALDTWFVEDDDPDYTLMFQLLNSAKRQGLGIPEKLSSIASALKAPGIIGAKSEAEDDDGKLPF